MKKILFVCLGNICRSPLAEALFRKHVKDKGLEAEFSCDSCGTAAFQIGAPPDTRSVANALSHGLVYTHRSRQLGPKDFVDFDYILAMDNGNLARIIDMNHNNHQHILMLRDFDPVDKGRDVPDPYFGSDDRFQDVYIIIEKATLHLLNQLSKS